MTRQVSVREWPEELLIDVDVLVGGTPCQAFSLAGQSRGRDDERQLEAVAEVGDPHLARRFGVEGHVAGRGEGVLGGRDDPHLHGVSAVGAATQHGQPGGARVDDHGGVSDGAGVARQGGRAVAARHGETTHQSKQPQNIR